MMLFNHHVGINLRAFIYTLAISFCTTSVATRQASASTNLVTHIDHAIIKEPKYRSSPKYSLITLGNHGDVRVWMIEDGKQLFLDKNANGDLTDDGPPIQPGNFR